MASKELISAVESYKKYINQNGVDEQVIDALVLATRTAFSEGDKEYALKVSLTAKNAIETLVTNETGADIWRLERYAQEKEIEYSLVNKFYEILKLESRDRFESFIYYMERKRLFQKRFYQPRKKALHIVVQDLQDLEDGKFKF